MNKKTEDIYFKRRDILVLEDNIKLITKNHKVLRYGFFGFMAFMSVLAIIFSNIEHIENNFTKFVLISFVILGIFDIRKEMKQTGIEGEIIKKQKEIDDLVHQKNEMLNKEMNT